MIHGYVYVFRHGQTFDNKNGVFSGWRDSVLTPAGEKNARTLAQKLKNKSIIFAFTSHLTRMRHTLREVLRFHPQAVVVEDDRVIERCYGDLQGHTHAKFIANYGKREYDKYHRGYGVVPPHGESIQMVEKRVFGFAQEVEKLVKERRCNVAVVCGNNSMRALRRYFEKLTVAQMMKLENPYDQYFEYQIGG
jgi:broad specificity phosphatase PhoE